MDSKLIPANQIFSKAPEFVGDGVRLEKERILIVEDNPVALRMLERSLNDSGYLTCTAATGADCFDKVSHDFALVILDLNLPDIDGYTCLNFLSHYFHEIPVLILSSSGTKDAVRSIKYGAVNYIQKPVRSDELVEALQYHILEKKSQIVDKEFTSIEDLLIGKAPATAILMQQIESKVLGDHLLFTGYSGKYSLAKLLARRQHDGEARYITCHCHEFEQRPLEMALKSRAETTLILKDVENLNQEQVLFLTNQLASSCYKISLTSRQDLKVLQKLPCGKFFDLYDFQEFCLPSLSTRKEDLPGIVKHLMQKKEFENLDVSDEDIEKMIDVAWDNIEDLEDCLRRNLALPQVKNQKIKSTSLVMTNTKDINSRGRYANIVGLPLSEIEKIAILETIEACGGNKSKAARILQITEKTIYNKLSQYS